MISKLTKTITQLKEFINQVTDFSVLEEETQLTKEKLISDLDQQQQSINNNDPLVADQIAIDLEIKYPLLITTEQLSNIYEEIFSDATDIITDIRTHYINIDHSNGIAPVAIRKNEQSFATVPGRIIVSKEHLDQQKPLFKMGIAKKIAIRSKIHQLKKQVYLGDVNPAIVVSLDPLLVSAYSWDLNTVVMLKFPNEYVKMFDLKLNDHLISVNGYYETLLHHDIFYGKSGCYYKDYLPTIVDFISDQKDLLDHYRRIIPEYTWDLVEKISYQYRSKFPHLSRFGQWFFE